MNRDHVGKKIIALCCAVFWAVLIACAAQGATKTYVFSGHIADITGKPLAGAEVSFYKSKNVKKPADFVSNRTGVDGSYQVALPEGVYWAFATFRKDGRKFGPLGLEDKHSGEAVEVSISEDDDLQMDFVVMDLREAAKKVQKKNKSLVRVSGRILDHDGKPVKMAYAMADSVSRFKEIPKYLSAWTDESGEFVLFLPVGKYYFGTAVGFPPDADYSLSQVLTIDKETAGVDFTLPNEK